MASFSQKGRGEAYVEEADKALKKFTFFSSSQKYEDAAELYTKAGNCFKVSSSWQEGGEAYMKAADLYQNKVRESRRMIVAALAGERGILRAS
jgi:hypothetical protein